MRLRIAHALGRLWRPGWSQRLRSAGLALVLLYVANEFLKKMGSHVPVQTWLFWRYARVIAICAGWALCCVSAGHGFLTRFVRGALPLLEHATLSFALGLLLFSLAMFLGGLLALFGPVFAVALPLVIFAASAPAFGPYVWRALRHLRWARKKPRPPAPLWGLPIALFGLAGVGMLYFLILSPDNVGYDARWYHLALGEHYVAQGAIRASPEGWYPAAFPQLATLLYSWALQVPGLDFFDHIELAAHLEFTVFLFTLAGIPVLVRAVVQHARAHLAWVALFLFPGILLYDSSLVVGADHVAAVWAVPIYVSMKRALRELDARRVALFAAMISGAALTKYQCAALIAGPALVLFFRFLWLAASAARVGGRPPRQLWQAPAVAVSLGALFTAPHWLKNWAFYGDPLYPFLHKYLHHLHPWTADSAERFEATVTSRDPFVSRGPLLERLHETLFDGVLRFSFKAHDYPFHGDIPVFGSLFTLLVLALPFLRGSARTALLFACGNVGVFTWYWTAHEERYLQPQVPWMAGAVAAALILIWRSGMVGRFACAPLVAAQVIWGGDVYFFPTHAMVGQSQIKPAIDLLSARFRKDERALSPFGVWSDLRRALPRGSKVLVHQQHVHFGLGTMSVNDSEFLEGGIDYGRLENPRAVYDLLKSYGVTHLLTVSSWQSEDSLGGDLIFWQFAKLYAVDPTPFAEGVTVARMPAAAPAGPFLERAVVRVCGGAGMYRDGLYRVSDLTLVDHVNGSRPAPVPESPFESGAAATAALARAQFAIVRPSCDPALASSLPSSSFRSIGARGELQYWSRAP